MPLHTDLALKRIADAAKIVGGSGTLASMAGLKPDVARRLLRPDPASLRSLKLLEQEAQRVLEKNRPEPSAPMPGSHAIQRQQHAGNR